MHFNWLCMTVFIFSAIPTNARRVGLQKISLTNVLEALQQDINKLKGSDENTKLIIPNFSVRDQRSSAANNLQYMARYQTAAYLLRKCGKSLVLPFSRSYNGFRHSSRYQDCLRRLKSALEELPSQTRFFVQQLINSGKKTQKPFVDLTRSAENTFHSQANGQRASRKYLASDQNYKLANFLPKRWFWQEEDVPKLDTFWYHGPLGVQVIFR